MNIFDALLGLSIGSPAEKARQQIIANSASGENAPALTPPTLQPETSANAAVTQPDVVQPVVQPRVQPLNTSEAIQAVDANAIDPMQTSEAYKSPPDLSKMYVDMMQSTLRQQQLDRGLTLIAAGLAQDQNKGRLIELASQSGGSSDGSGNTMFKTLFELQEKAAASARRDQMRSALPGIAKAHGLSLQDVQVMFENDTLDEFLKDAANPETEVVERADGSKVLINKDSGAELREVSGAKPREKEYRTINGKNIQVYKDTGDPVNPNTKLPTEFEEAPDLFFETDPVTGDRLAFNKKNGQRLKDRDIKGLGKKITYVSDGQGGQQARDDAGNHIPEKDIPAKEKIEYHTGPNGSLIATSSITGAHLVDKDVPGKDEIEIVKLGDGTNQAYNKTTQEKIGKPFGAPSDTRTDDMKEYTWDSAAREARGLAPTPFDEWLKAKDKSRDVKPTSGNVDPKTGIDWGDPSPDMTYKRNPDGSFVMNPETNTPVEVTKSGSKKALEEQATEDKAAQAAENKKLAANVMTAKTDEAMGILGEDSYSTPVTGITGAIASLMPGSRRIDLEAALDTVKANLAFDKLQAMRDASPTGGALGNVSDTELRLLSSTFGSLNINQSPAALKANLKLIHDIMSGDPEAIEKFRREYVGKENSGTTEKPAEKPAGNEPPKGAKKYRWDPVKKQKVPIE